MTRLLLSTLLIFTISTYVSANEYLEALKGVCEIEVNVSPCDTPIRTGPLGTGTAFLVADKSEDSNWVDGEYKFVYIFITAEHVVEDLTPKTRLVTMPNGDKEKITSDPHFDLKIFHRTDKGRIYAVREFSASKCESEYVKYTLTSYPALDMAILIVKSKSAIGKISPMQIATKEEVDNVTIGDRIIGAGCSNNTPMVREGKIGEIHARFFQSNSQVAPGDSGGPLIKDGKVIGVMTNRMSVGTFSQNINALRKRIKDPELKEAIFGEKSN